MIFQHACRLARHLKTPHHVRSMFLVRLPSLSHRGITRSVSLSLCCAFIGAASQGHCIGIGLSRAHCQSTVTETITEPSQEPNVPVESEKSSRDFDLNQLRCLVRTIASNVVQGVLIALRFIRNSLLFGPLLVCYPLVVLFPDRFQAPWLGALLRAVELSGPAFIKLGQWASTRRDLFQQTFCDRMAKLHRNAPSHSLEYSRQALEKAFGLMWREVLRFERRVGEEENAPVYSGCVGQVHKSYMRADVYEAVMEGRREGLRNWTKSIESSEDTAWVPVAVKVLHPGVLESVHLDLKIMNVFARILHLIPGLQWLSPVGLVEEFEALMKNQINLKLEAENLDRFHKNFSKVPYVRIPQPVWPFVTEDVLIETYETGQNMSSFVDCDGDSWGHGDLKKCLAEMGVDVILKMVFTDNLVHADLHPGNILVQGAEEHIDRPRRRVRIVDQIDEFQVWPEEAPSPLSLVLLDTGITSHLQDQDFDKFFKVFSAIAQSRGDIVAELFLNHSPSCECKDPEGFKADMSHLIEKAHEQTLKLGMMQVGYLLGDLFSLLIHYKVKLDSNFASVILAIMVLEGLGRSLDPTLDILEAAKPILLGR